MAGAIKIRVDGGANLTRVMNNIDPSRNPEFVRRALIKGGLLVQKNAAEKQIKRGGRAKPLPNKLTSRSGTGRRSIRTDRSGLPRFFVDIGSDLKYMQLHETGGTVTRRSSKGNTHQATFPPRPYMAPALAAVNTDLGGAFFREWDRALKK